MKKLVVSYLLLLAVIAVACHRKTVPATTETAVVTAPVVVTPVVPAAPVYAEADLAAGKTIYETKCAKCHGAKPLDHWTVEGWKPILKSMIPKARLDSVQAAQVTAYVNTNAKK